MEEKSLAHLKRLICAHMDSPGFVVDCPAWSFPEGSATAQVLAAQVEADLVIVLDATYAVAEQGVRIGDGAVITLSDASVLLSLATRDHLLRIMREADVPIQFEAYNYSGTDSRAFPQQGKSTPVLPLLIPTHGNHSPCETAHIADLAHWEAAIKALELRF